MSFVNTDYGWPSEENADNYGIPELGARSWAPWGKEADLKKLHERCKFSNASLYSGLGLMAAVNFYADHHAYGSWRGHDLVSWWSLTPFRKAWPIMVPALDQPPVHTRYCEVHDGDGVVWHVQRVGPFRSTGGYDWWQISARDFSRISAALRSMGPGVFLTSHFVGPVDSSGQALSYPPIHMHHFHINPSRWFVRHRFPDVLCFFGYCYSPNLVVEQHGDYVCHGQGEGLESDNCYLESTPPGYGKQLSVPLDLEGEMNDVRPPKSEPMEWWLEMAVRLEPSSVKLKPLSSFYILSPGRFNPFYQFGYSFLFPEPTDHLSIQWFTGRTPRAGRLVRNKAHLHMTLIDESLFFAARPDQLGIDGATFRPSRPWAAVSISQTGFTDFSAVRAHLMMNLALARQTSVSEGMEWLGKPLRQPRLVCSARRGLGKVNGSMFDRRGNVFCRHWNFEEGETFTIVSFLRHKGTPDADIADGIPASLPMHVHWFFQYEAHAVGNDPPQSYYDMTMLCQDVRWQSSPFMFFPGPHLLQFLVWGGMPCSRHLHPLPAFALGVFVWRVFVACLNRILMYLWERHRIQASDCRVGLATNGAVAGISCFVGFDGLMLLALVNCGLAVAFKLLPWTIGLLLYPVFWTYYAAKRCLSAVVSRADANSCHDSHAVFEQQDTACVHAGVIGKGMPECSTSG